MGSKKKYETRKIAILFPVELETRARNCGLLEFSSMTALITQSVLDLVLAEERKKEIGK